MGVRAKMRVVGHKVSLHSKSVSPEWVQVTMQPVYGEGEFDSNSQWSKWTPSGELTLTISNPEAYEQLKLGQAYYVDINPAD